MKIKNLNRWDVDYSEAAIIQKSLAEALKFVPLKKDLRFIAGADVSSQKGDNRVYASVVVLSLPSLKVVESQSAYGVTQFPYVPGFLAFREIPVLCMAFEKLRNIPDAVICDGHGIAHPRGVGLASHLGLILDIPTVGCAKSRLIGDFVPVGERKMDWSNLEINGKTAGAVLRTRVGTKPVFVSPGHRIDLESSIRLIGMCLTRYRLPEPTRLAHQYVNLYRGKVGCRS